MCGSGLEGCLGFQTYADLEVKSYGFRGSSDLLLYHKYKKFNRRKQIASQWHCVTSAAKLHENVRLKGLQ